MTEILNAKTFFTYFIYNTNSVHLSNSEKKKALAGRIIFTIFTLNIVPSLCRHIGSKYSLSLLKNLKTDEYKKNIQECNDLWAGKNYYNNNKETKEERKERKEAEDTPCHEIINGLFLGNSEAFAQTTFQNIRKNDSSQQPTISLNTFNPKKFRTIITMCPLKGVTAEFLDLENASLPRIEKIKLFFHKKTMILSEKLHINFKKRNITWFYVGKTLGDNAEEWSKMIHDSTFLSHKDSQIEFSEKGMSEKEFEDITNRKREQIKTITESDWFAPIFNEIDKAVFTEKKTLVHCAQGISRSSTILAAYLINRFGVTSEEAIRYLQSKRLCVKPKFAKELKQYAIALGHEKNPEEIDNKNTENIKIEEIENKNTKEESIEKEN